jgi:hypothetical protein
MQYFYSATVSETGLETVCKLAAEGLVCTANCAYAEFVGVGFTDKAKTAYEEAAMRSLEHIAEKSASQFLKRGVPVLNVILTTKDLYGTATCTIDCVEQ